jgi:hypothetical protein
MQKPARKQGLNMDVEGSTVYAFSNVESIALAYARAFARTLIDSS